MTRTILVAGSANLDFVVRADRIPAPGETVMGSDLRTYPGGKGANQAIACARAGGTATAMLLALGDDAQAAPIEQSLREAGVLLHTRRIADRATGTAFICVSASGENAITVAPGANAALRPEDLPPLSGIRYLLLQLETPLPSVTAWALAARAAGVQVVLNAAPAQALPAELLAAVDLLVVNEGELATLTGVQGDVAAALSAPAVAGVATVVVTLGSAGCVARQAGELSRQAAFPVDPVDTTAAGDTFCGALVAEMASGADLPTALRHASAAAALTCTRPGAQASIPTRAEVLALLSAHPQT